MGRPIYTGYFPLNKGLSLEKQHFLCLLNNYLLDYIKILRKLTFNSLFLKNNFK